MHVPKNMAQTNSKSEVAMIQRRASNTLQEKNIDTVKINIVETNTLRTNTVGTNIEYCKDQYFRN